MAILVRQAKRLLACRQVRSWWEPARWRVYVLLPWSRHGWIFHPAAPSTSRRLLLPL